MDVDWQALDSLSIILGILSTVFAATAAVFSVWQRWSARKEGVRLNQEIFIRLSCSELVETIDIPFSLRRREITRSEILGLIGMLPMKAELKRFRYEIHYLSTSEFREELSRTQDSSGSDTLLIECNGEELGQFDMEKFNDDNRS